MFGYRRIRYSSIFSEPYPCPVSARQRWLISILIGLGVFAFLYLFRPFGLGEQQRDPVLLIAAGYGIVTFLVTLFNVFVFPVLFPTFFNEKQWTVGRHLLFTIWIFITVGIVNFFYSQMLGFTGWDLQGFLYVQWMTILVGAFPVSLVILVSYAYLLRRNLRSALDLEQALLSRVPSAPAGANELIEIPSEKKEENLQLLLNDLLYMTSADNYVEVVFRDRLQVKKTLLRNTLTGMESLSVKYPMLYRCHRAYLVNLDKIKTITGNSQGCRLILKGAEESIPVSRRKYKELLRKVRQ